jgi:hypothetical protein
VAFPQWLAGQIITADRLNARNVHLVTQDSDQVVTSSTALVDSEIEIPVVAGAVYSYTALIAYNATTTSDFRWAWSYPLDTVVLRFTQSYVEGASVGFASGAEIVQRRPAGNTSVVAGGKAPGGQTPPADTAVAIDQGTIAVSASPGTVRLRFAQGTSSPDQTILRGDGTQTRVLYQRIA